MHRYVLLFHIEKVQLYFISADKLQNDILKLYCNIFVFRIINQNTIMYLR